MDNLKRTNERLTTENKRLKKQIGYLNAIRRESKKFLNKLDNIELEIEYEWYCDECGLAWEDYEEHYKCQLCYGDFCLTHLEYSGTRCSECEDVLCCHKCRKNGQTGDFSKCKCGTCIAFLEDCDEKEINDPFYYRCARCSGVGHPL